MTDRLRYSYPDLIGANKSLSYKKMINERGKAFLGFLARKGFILINPFKENGEIKDDLRVFSSNLTQEGVELFEKPFARWISYLDKGGDINDLSRLEKELMKISSKRD
jgi:hypothetical protein